jgi:hypothetical protein
MQLWKLLILGFIAGFFATLIFHQGLWYLFNQAGAIPPDRPAWPMDAIPPFGVPSVISKSFWGGLWGAALALALGQLSGATYWAAWIVVARWRSHSLPSSSCCRSKARPSRRSGRASPQDFCSTVPGASAPVSS